MALTRAVRLATHGRGKHGGGTKRLLAAQRDGEEEDSVAALVEHAIEMAHTRLGRAFHQGEVLVEKEHGEVEKV